MRVTPALTPASSERNVQIGDQITTHNYSPSLNLLSHKSSLFQCLQNHKIFQAIIIISPATVKRCQELIQYILLQICTLYIPS